MCAWEHYKDIVLEDSILTDNTRNTRKSSVHLKNILFFKLCATYVHMFTGITCVEVPTNARRGLRLLWDGSYR